MLEWSLIVSLFMLLMAAILQRRPVVRADVRIPDDSLRDFAQFLSETMKGEGVGEASAIECKWASEFCEDPSALDRHLNDPALGGWTVDRVLAAPTGGFYVISFISVDDLEEAGEPAPFTIVHGGNAVDGGRFEG